MTPQERYEQLAKRGFAASDTATVLAIGRKLTEVKGAIYGDHYDTIYLVLGALAEVTGAPVVASRTAVTR